MPNYNCVAFNKFVELYKLHIMSLFTSTNDETVYYTKQNNICIQWMACFGTLLYDFIEKLLCQSINISIQPLLLFNDVVNVAPV